MVCEKGELVVSLKTKKDLFNGEVNGMTATFIVDSHEILSVSVDRQEVVSLLLDMLELTDVFDVRERPSVRIDASLLSEISEIMHLVLRGLYDWARRSERGFTIKLEEKGGTLQLN